MSPLFQKLNLKHQTEICVINPPESFAGELAALREIKVVRDPTKADAIHFAIVFASQQKEVDALAKILAAKAVGDAVLWFGYPKSTSKKFRCEFNRDSGWKVLRSLGFDSVRQIAIDGDWSALRFRRAEFIGT